MTRYHHGDLKNALIKAGEKIISEKGVDALSIRSAAKTLKVSHSAPYRHFKNKEQFVMEISLRGFEKLSQIIDTEIAKGNENTKDTIINILKSLIGFASKEKNLYKIMFGDVISYKTTYIDLFDAYDSLFNKMTELILKYRSGKKMSSKREDAHITVITLFSLAHGYASLIIDNKKDKNVGSKTQTDLVMNKIEQII